MKRRAMTQTMKCFVKVPDFIAARVDKAPLTHTVIVTKAMPKSIGTPDKSVPMAATRTLSPIIIQEASIFWISGVKLLHAIDAFWRSECKEAMAFIIPSVGC